MYNRNLKIGILATEFSPRIGGMHTYAVNLGRELQNRGHEVHIFASAGTDDCREVRDLTVHRILTGNPWDDRKTLEPWNMDIWHAINAVYSVVSLYKPYVFVSIHGKDFVSPWLSPKIKVEFFSKLKKSPYIWRFNWKSLDLNLERVGSRFLLKHGYRNAQKIFANSCYTAARFRERYPGNKSKICIAYVGVEPSFFKIPHRSNGGKRRILTVSRLSYLSLLKNVDKVILALGTLRNKFDFEYIVVGDGTLRSELEKLAKKCGIGDKIRFLGFISSDALHEIYSSSDFFVLTSSATDKDFEGFGIVYIEANAAGIPVLACRQGGSAEAVNEGISGFFVDMPTENQIAKKIAQYLSAEVTFDETSIRQHALKFTWSKTVDIIEKHYLDAVVDKDSPKNIITNIFYRGIQCILKIQKSA